MAAFVSHRLARASGRRLSPHVANLLVPVGTDRHRAAPPSGGLEGVRCRGFHSTSSASSSISANKKLDAKGSVAGAPQHSGARIPTPSACRHKKYIHSLNEDTPFQICFLRHGQSTWNRDNRFIGWTDTPLTDDGVLEARVAGQMLKRSGIRFDEVHTSLLRRSIRTTNLVLMELHQEYIPVHKHWRLNERSYGDLVGQNKKEAVKRFGKDQVKIWRRSYDVPPPPMSPHHPYHPARDPRYGPMLGEIPLTESLKDTVDRSAVYWDEVLAPAVREGKTLLVVGHENNLRSLLMRLEDIDKDDILHLNLPRAVPLAYRLDMDTLKPLDRPDGKRDEATGFLRGTWIGGDTAVKEILDRDYRQVYDTNVTQNLEIGDTRDKWNAWMEFLVGKPSPYQKAAGCDSQVAPAMGDFDNVGPVPAVERDPLEDCSRKRSAAGVAATPIPMAEPHIEERNEARAA